MITNNISALINLLDDPDSEVYNAVSMQLLGQGIGIIPELEEAWEKSSNEIVQRRIEAILKQIQQNVAYAGMQKWINNDNADVLEGAYWVAKFQYPELNYKQIDRYIEKIKTSVWLEINDGLTAFEKMQIINHFIYDIYNFSSEQDFMQPPYCYINHVIETRKGNPVTLGILYLAICQRLDLPVYGICLPRNFLLIYNDVLNADALFYINPFYKGSVLTQADIRHYLNQIKIKSKEVYFTPRSNKAVILRLVETLAYIYEQEEADDKAEVFKKLIPMFGNRKTYFQDDE